MSRIYPGLIAFSELLKIEKKQGCIRYIQVRSGSCMFRRARPARPASSSPRMAANRRVAGNKGYVDCRAKRVLPGLAADSGNGLGCGGKATPALLPSCTPRIHFIPQNLGGRWQGWRFQGSVCWELREQGYD